MGVRINEVEEIISLQLLHVHCAYSIHHIRYIYTCIYVSSMHQTAFICCIYFGIEWFENRFIFWIKPQTHLRCNNRDYRPWTELERMNKQNRLWMDKLNVWDFAVFRFIKSFNYIMLWRSVGSRTRLKWCVLIYSGDRKFEIFLNIVVDSSFRGSVRQSKVWIIITRPNLFRTTFSPEWCILLFEILCFCNHKAIGSIVHPSTAFSI